VCGATKLVSLDKLHSEVPWESLESRRNNHMLILLYKMKNGLTPDYLCSLLPPTVGENSRYDLRNATNIQTIRTRTTLYQNAFLPTALNKWNALPTEVQNLRSLFAFKSHLRRSSSSCPIYFYEGDRKWQIFHARLRTECSSLNQHLFKKNISPSPLCQCGIVESNYHFFFECHRYADSRASFLNTISTICSATLQKLLNGDPNISDDANRRLFEAVHTYIRESRRFS
jgi:hypothetical protein